MRHGLRKKGRHQRGQYIVKECTTENFGNVTVKIERTHNNEKSKRELTRVENPSISIIFVDMYWLRQLDAIPFRMDKIFLVFFLFFFWLL